MQIYTQNCETFNGNSIRTSRAVIAYNNGEYVTTGYFDLSAAGYGMELVWMRDMSVTLNGTTYYGVWMQHKLPRDW